jgi:Domain of unknown function (DUF6089)
MIQNFKNSKYTLLALALLLSVQSFAQKGLFSRKNVVNQYSTIGVGGGSSHYFGDLAPYSKFYYGIYTNVRWNAHINYTRYFSPKMAAKVSFTYARIFGDDNKFSSRNINQMPAQYVRNLHFRNDLQEFTLSGIYNIMPQYGKGAKGRSNYMPYVSAGIGLYGHNPVARGAYYTNGELKQKPFVALKSLRTSGQGLPGSSTKPYSLVQPVMPIAIGIRVKINQNFDFTAEAGMRLTPFDYLDDVGAGNYPSSALLIANGYQTVDSPHSYRADEDYNALTGTPRILNFYTAVSALNSGIIPGGGVTPDGNAKNIYPESTSFRGTSKFDSYILTQFTISYVLSNHIKCPPVR